MGEESTFAETGAAGAGSTENIGSSPVWVIDPLDGTTNFVSTSTLSERSNTASLRSFAQPRFLPTDHVTGNRARAWRQNTHPA